jgi:hypothetical protein
MEFPLNRRKADDSCYDRASRVLPLRGREDHAPATGGFFVARMTDEGAMCG